MKLWTGLPAPPDRRHRKGRRRQDHARCRARPAAGGERAEDAAAGDRSAGEPAPAARHRALRRQDHQGRTRLGLQNLQPRAVVEGLVREKVPIAALAQKIVASAVFQQFVEGAPGTQGDGGAGLCPAHRPRATTATRPTSWCWMLRPPVTAPRCWRPRCILAEAVGGGQLGDMARELAEFIADPAACGVVLPTLAEEMPVQETTRADRAAAGAHRAARRSWWSPTPSTRCIPRARPPGRAPGRAADRILELWRDRRAVNDRELARLRQDWSGTAARAAAAAARSAVPLCSTAVVPALEEELA